jgi:segregation and condensation protein B
MKEPTIPAEGAASEESQEGLTPGAPETGTESATEPAVEPAAEPVPEAAPEPAQPSVPVELVFVPDAAPDLGLEAVPMADVPLRAVLEALIYVAEEPLTLAQIVGALGEPAERIGAVLNELMAEFERPEHGLSIREVAGGYKMATKAEHHEAVRNFVKSLKPPLKLSLPALETLAVVAYKQPVTAPEIMEIRGVQGAGVLKTLLDRKLIAVAGRKDVIGKPMLYKTTKEFMIQFGLKDLSELPSLKEFEEIRRMAFSDADTPAADAALAPVPSSPFRPSSAEPAPQPTPVEMPGEVESAPPPEAQTQAGPPEAPTEAGSLAPPEAPTEAGSPTPPEAPTEAGSPALPEAPTETGPPAPPPETPED